MASWRSATDLKTPRRIRLRVMMEKKPSTALRQEAEAGLGAVESLDLAFLVDRDDDGMSGRVHIEADDIFDLVGEGRVVGFLEAADPVGLETVGLPDALHGAQADTDRLVNHASGPMRGLSRRLAAGQCQDLGHGRGGR